MTTVTTPAVDTTQIHDSIMDAIGIAEADGVLVSLMPADVFEGAGFEEEDGWTEGNGLHEFRKALFAHLGNHSIQNGDAEGFMRRYRHRGPHEFSSPTRPCVSVYLTYVHDGGRPSYLIYEIGPSGGHPDDVPD